MLCTRISVNTNTHCIVHQNQCEYKCTQICVPESVQIGTYTAMCIRINMNTGVELCTGISKNRNIHGVVYQNQYEHKCTQSCLPETVEIKHAISCSKINTNANEQMQSQQDVSSYPSLFHFSSHFTLAAS
jgi:hypothetical protein